MTSYSRRTFQRSVLEQKTRQALIMFQNGKTATYAAKELGISRMTLYRGLKALGDSEGRVYEPRILAKHPDQATASTPATSERDPLLDGWEPECVTPVTDSDIDELLA